MTGPCCERCGSAGLLSRRCRCPSSGVNLGKLGFLAEIDVPELPDALTAIDEHRFRVERRAAVQAVLPDGTTTLAFNDVALVRVPGDRVAAVEVRVSGEGFVRYAADAIVVATPTGSTAYSYAAGGPIVSPSVEGLLVIPAAAHASFNRALLLAADEPLSLDLLPSSGVLAVEVDGRVECQAGPGDTRGAVTRARGGPPGAARHHVLLPAGPSQAAGDGQPRGRRRAVSVRLPGQSRKPAT